MRVMNAIVWFALMTAGSVAWSAESRHTAAELQKDIANHRAMAEAHTRMASCLESGKGEKVCLEQLARDCKGLAIGKYCGMRHAH